MFRKNENKDLEQEKLERKVNELEQQNKDLEEKKHQLSVENMFLQDKLDSSGIITKKSPVTEYYSFSGTGVVEMHLINGEIVGVQITANELNEFLNEILKSKAQATVAMRTFVSQDLETKTRMNVVLVSSDVVGVTFLKVENESE